MNNHLSKRTLPWHGFTLVELLVVIAIIAVLAGIILPTLAYAKKATKVKVAKMEMAHLQTAIAQYESDYDRMPISNEAMRSTTDLSPDFTCGTVTREGSVIAPSRVDNVNNSGYQNVNSELVAPLRNMQIYPNEKNALNPRKIVYFESRDAVSVNLPGIGPDGVFRDPWGSPYIVTVDINDDGKCQDGIYYLLTKGAKSFLGPGKTMVWSLGPDKMATIDSAVGTKGGVNKDNVLHWD